MKEKQHYVRLVEGDVVREGDFFFSLGDMFLVTELMVGIRISWRDTAYLRAVSSNTIQPELIPTHRKIEVC